MRWIAAVVLAGLLVSCGEGEVTPERVWREAGVSEPCEPGVYAPCMAVVRVPPETLRERLGAPAWDTRGADQVTMVGSVLLQMRPASGGWLLDVSQQ
ncbi:hypothetical protein [Deinococcus sp. UR1]|uniref:hypothetical protein n=1 Tax=Deinococcus sp. UR1 TaxID=1704277 RepID=UPI0011AF59F9|nr:hypothetical protein [Deinococcus sp. UR1]